MDMYLQGRTYRPYIDLRPDSPHPKDEDGLPITITEVELGHWANHYRLHRYIVEHYGYSDGWGVDLVRDDIAEILQAIKDDALPIVTDYDADEQDLDLDYAAKVFEHALKWITANQEAVATALAENKPLRN